MRFLGIVVACAVSAASFSGCAITDDADPEVGDGEGVDFDEDGASELEDSKADRTSYMIPTGLPRLAAPEIIVSLTGLTVHLFDRETGFSAVYPAGVGTKNSRGLSITPDGHFRTGTNPRDRWWFVERRSVPAYFAGLPFLRLDVLNSRGVPTYGLHGPITENLIRGYVSHGCVRMAKDDVINLFWMVREHTQVPVTIQQEVEKDANGQVVDVGTSPALYPVGAQINFGASVGPRPF